MKSPLLPAKRGDVANLWADDAFGRKEDAAFLQEFLSGRTNERKSSGMKASYVLNIDAGWGRGKSYFLDRFASQLEGEGFLVARINAWKDDHADDPLLAVMSAIESSLAPFLKGGQEARRIWKSVKSNAASIIVAAVKGGAKHWSKKALGEGVDEVINLLADESGDLDALEEGVSEQVSRLIDQEADHLLQKFSQTQKSIYGFKSELERLLLVIEAKGQAKLPLFVLVDELDRCRPPYAIKFLERVKHLFEIDGVAFVVATDTRQLSHAIRAIYGQEFDAEKYLYRFFDRTYRFEQPSRQAFVQALLAKMPVDGRKVSLPPQTQLGEYLTQAFDYFNLPLRDCEQCLDIFGTILTGWTIAFPLEVTVMLPLIVGYQQGIDLGKKDFTARMQSIAQKHEGGLEQWVIQFQGSVDGRGRHEAKMVGGLPFCDIFRTEAAKMFAELIPQAEELDAANSWIVDRLMAEWEFLRGLHAHANKQISMINDYTRMVRSAGRLVPI